MKYLCICRRAAESNELGMSIGMLWNVLLGEAGSHEYNQCLQLLSGIEASLIQLVPCHTCTTSPAVPIKAL